MNHLSLLETIQSRYSLEPIHQVSRLTGGEWKTLWRLEGAQTSYVASLSHPTASEESMLYEHRLLRHLQTRLPQAPAPILARDGSSYFVDQGRIVCLLPFMPGAMADGDQVWLPAARFLATFHRVGLTYPDQSARPGVPAWCDWDWCAAEWSWIEEALASTPATTTLAAQRFWQGTREWARQIIKRREQIASERAYFQRWLADLAGSHRNLTVGPLHDDYHGNNLLMEGERVTALLDWDGCHPDWLVLDVANATWEFCLDDQAHTLDHQAARRFLQAYAEAGGPVTQQEFELVIPFIRCRRMIEIMSSLRGIVSGGAWDESPDYLVHNLLALENLRGISL
jgi:Ser/Thr protein kinase RdoA (MazF antagonist)